MIVVSFRSGRDLPGLISSIDAAVSDCSWHLVIVDNAGEDLSAGLPVDQRITVVDAGGNLGFSGGINVGLRAAPAARWTLFLNPDLILHPGSVSALLSVPAEAVASVPRIVDGAGVRQNSLRREPSLLRAIGEAVFGDRWPSRPAALSETVRDEAAYATTHSIEWATGAILAVRTEAVIGTGPWDAERFFMYSEETDYARRLREGARPIIYVPAAAVEHRAGGSGTSPDLDALLEVNKVRYYAKWHGSVAAAAFGAVTLLRNALRLHRPGARAAVRALLSSRARASLPGGAR